MGKEQLYTDLSRVPFAIWIFILAYLIYRLYGVGQDIEDQRENFKVVIVDTCFQVQNATTELANLHKTVALRGIQETAEFSNFAADLSLDALRGVSKLAVDLAFLVLQFKTKTARCSALAVIDLGSRAFVENADHVEMFVNEQLNATIEGLQETFDFFADSINEASSTVQGYIDQYNSVLLQLQSNDIDLPPLNVDFPTVSAPQIPLVSFPNTTGWESPDYQDLEDQLLELINPLRFINDQIDRIQIANLSAQDLVERLGLEEELQYEDLDFCQGIDFAVVDREVDRLVVGVRGSIIATAVFMFLLMGVEVAVVVVRYRKGKYWRPLWCTEALSEFFRYVWHKPSFLCIALGLLGIILFHSLRLGTLAAKDSFEENVVSKVRNFSEHEIGLIVDDVNEISRAFASDINSELDKMELVLNQIVTDMNSAAQELQNVQDEANEALDESVGQTTGFAGSYLVEGIQCLSVILDLPLEDTFNLFPEQRTLNRVSEDSLSLNETKIQQYINDNLDRTTQIYDWYADKLLDEVVYFYCLMAYGFPVIIAGLCMGCYNVCLKKKGK